MNDESLEKLREQLAALSEEGGLRTSFMMDMPQSVRRIVRVLLRARQPLTLAELSAKLPADTDLSPPDLLAVVTVLCEMQWFQCLEGESDARYAVRLAESGSPPSTSNRAQSIWQSLEDDL